MTEVKLDIHSKSCYNVGVMMMKQEQECSREALQALTVRTTFGERRRKEEGGIIKWQRGLRI